MTSAPYVEVKNLRRVFDVSKPWLNRVLEGGDLEFLKAVDGVSFDIRKGETFALVGESGSGKTTVARMVVGLLPPSSGDVVIDGVSMTDPRQAQARRRLRRRIQMIFQDPYASLNPRFRVDAIIADPRLRPDPGRAADPGPRRRTPGSCRPASRRRHQVSARIFRRAAPAHRDR